VFKSEPDYQRKPKVVSEPRETRKPCDISEPQNVRKPRAKSVYF